jgi:hypothetical protein
LKISRCEDAFFSAIKKMTILQKKTVKVVLVLFEEKYSLQSIFFFQLMTDTLNALDFDR